MCGGKNVDGELESPHMCNRNVERPLQMVEEGDNLCVCVVCVCVLCVCVCVCLCVCVYVCVCVCVCV